MVDRLAGASGSQGPGIPRSPAVDRTGPVGTPPGVDPRREASKGDAFQTALKEAIERRTAQEAGIRFSRHARERLSAGGIQMTPERLREIRGAVDRAAAKGAKDALVLAPDLALVVSITNRTVVTAVEQARMREHVFTNIDSAVILDGGQRWAR